MAECARSGPGSQVCYKTEPAPERERSELPLETLPLTRGRTFKGKQYPTHALPSEIIERIDRRGQGRSGGGGGPCRSNCFRRAASCAFCSAVSTAAIWDIIFARETSSSIWILAPASALARTAASSKELVKGSAWPSRKLFN